jgi:hypothetical protein
MCGGGFCVYIYYKIHNNIIIYYSYIIYVVHSKPTYRSRNVRVVCVWMRGGYKFSIG